MTRFGMDVVLAHPEGYEVMPEVEEVAAENAEKSGGFFQDQQTWQKPSKMPISSIRRAGLPLPPWKREPNLYGRATRRASRLWRKNCWHRTHSTRTGLHRGTDEDHQRRQGAVSALPAGRHHRRKLQGPARWRQAYSTATVPLIQGSQLQALYHRRHDLPGQIR